MMKIGSYLKKEITQGSMPGAHRQGKPRTAWMDNIKTWTGLTMEESIRMAEDRRDKWRKYVHGVDNPRIEDGRRTEQDRLLCCREGRKVVGHSFHNKYTFHNSVTCVVSHTFGRFSSGPR